MVVSLGSLGFAPVTIWLAASQLQHARQFVGARMLELQSQRSGLQTYDSISGLPRHTEEVTVMIRYSGFAPLHGIAVHVMHGNSMIRIEGIIFLSLEKYAAPFV